MTNWPDEKIRNIAVWYIERSSIAPSSWRFTLIGDGHPNIVERIAIHEGELPVVSFYLSEASWYLFTTRRIVGTYDGKNFEEASAEILHYHLGNFKSYGEKETDVMRLTLPGGREVQLQYETGAASMAPIHYMLFWRLKYPVLDKLRFDPRTNSPSCPVCGNTLRTLEAQQCFHCGADWHGQPRPQS